MQLDRLDDDGAVDRDDRKLREDLHLRGGNLDGQGRGELAGHGDEDLGEDLGADDRLRTGCAQQVGSELPLARLPRSWASTKTLVSTKARTVVQLLARPRPVLTFPACRNGPRGVDETAQRSLAGVVACVAFEEVPDHGVDRRVRLDGAEPCALQDGVVDRHREVGHDTSLCRADRC